MKGGRQQALGSLKRAGALKEKGVPKATTQDSCFSHMIRAGQSLRVQPVEVEPAGAGQPAGPSPDTPGSPTGSARSDGAYPARRGCIRPLPTAREKKLKTLGSACLRVRRDAGNLFLLRSTPPSCRLISGEDALASFLKIMPVPAKKKSVYGRAV